MVFVTAAWDFTLLAGTPAWVPWLRWTVLVVGAAASLVLAAGGTAVKRLAVVSVVAAVLAGFGGTTAWALATAAQPHPGSIPSSGPTASRMGGMGGRGMDGGNSDAELTSLLTASTTKWAAAISGAISAADLELASGKSVIAIGGWDGSDPAPTLAEFQAMVAKGEIHYFISGGPGGGSSEIATWVAANYTAQTVGSSTVYDLTA